MTTRHQVLIALASLAAVACGPASAPQRATPAPVVGASSAPEAPKAPGLFDSNRVLAVDITMPAKDWDAVRLAGRDLSALATECRGPAKKIYPYVKARVTVDGVALDSVGVRKKGFLGSLSTERPSLKLKFDAFAAGQRMAGTRRMTLNNNKQDRALMRTCLVYKAFRDAGLAAPRCNFARVTVNGKRLGIYSHVERVGGGLLRRHFKSDKGALHEGQLADFVSKWLVNFEHKGRGGAAATPGATPATAPAPAVAFGDVVAALAKPDGELVGAVSKVVDYDEFLTFWAMETLTGHWDGYTNNRNNFFVYRDPAANKLHFIPWGADMAFTNVDPFHPGTRPAAVSADAVLANRLYANKRARADYVARMRKLLETVWNEKALLAEVDRIDALLGGAPDDKGVAEIKAFITGRKGKLAKELASGGGAWTARLRVEPCWAVGAAVHGTFQTKHGNLDGGMPMTQGKASLTLVVGGKTIKLAPLGVVAGNDKRAGGTPAVRFVGLSGSSIWVVQLSIDAPRFAPKTTQPFHGFATTGVVFELVGMRKLELRGFLGAGTVTLDKAGTTDGAPVSGSFKATLYEGPPKRAPATGE